MGWRRYAVRIVIVAAATAVAATCVESKGDRCADDSLCREGTRCVSLEGSARCAAPEQFAACDGAVSGSCVLGDVEGTCLGGACFVPVCGDDAIDSPEQCDDGNRVDGDGCSATCLSTETCGNGVTDLITGEQCDEGNPMLAGDGCTASCAREIRLWRDVSPREPTVRSGHTVVTDPVRGIMMFGGQIGTSGATFGSNVFFGAFNDAWRWDGAAWSELTSVPTPSRRAFAAMAYDPRRKRVVMFGGLNSMTVFENDTWEWDGIAWHKMSPATSPPARAGASFSCDMTSCFLFGGVKATDSSNSANFLADTWTWNGVTWSPVTSTGGPSARWRAAMVHDPDRDRYVLFGGHSGSNNLNNDTFEFGTSWAQRTVTAPAMTDVFPTMAFDERASVRQPTLVTHVLSPPNNQTRTYRLSATDVAWNSSMTTNMQLRTPAIALDRATGRLLAIGLNAGGTSWDAAEQTTGWFQRIRQSPNTGANTFSAAFDPLRGVTVLLASSGTWEWNGRSLGRVTSQLAGQPEHLGSTLAFDRACGELYAYGGGADTTALTDATWRYDPGSTSWSQVAIAQPLVSGRTLHSMTYDEERGVVLAFGGSTISGVTNELLALGGPCTNRVWQIVAPAGTSPPARTTAGMAYDAKRGVTVVFGGVSDAGSELGDTWEWNGVMWTERTPTLSPSARSQHALAYDPRRERIVLFGGADPMGRFDDTWEWNPAADTWERLGPALNPSQRSAMVLERDVMGELVAFGGVGPSGSLLPEIMRLSSELSTEKRESCRNAGEDLDGDGLAGCADPDCWGRCHPMCAFGQSCAGPHCGDGACSTLEDYLICPADCQAP